MFDSFVQELQTRGAGSMLLYLVVYGLPVVLVHFYLQVIKDRRRRRALPALDAFGLFAIAVPVTTLVALFFAAAVVEWPLRRAITAAITTGLCYPLLLILADWAISKRDPALADSLIGDDPTELAVMNNSEDPTEPKP